MARLWPSPTRFLHKSSSRDHSHVWEHGHPVYHHGSTVLASVLAVGTAALTRLSVTPSRTWIKFRKGCSPSSHARDQLSQNTTNYPEQSNFNRLGSSSRNRSSENPS
ncbi:hypothetical protein Dimus_011698 [Dionaea muscipula]